MEDLLESKILDNLYEIIEGEVENQYIKRYGNPKENKKTEKSEKQLVKFMEKLIKDETNMKILYEKLNKFELCAMGEMCFWYKPYYKKGFIDGISLKKQIKEEKSINNSREESIIYQNINEISDFFEEQKYKNLKQNNDYMKIVKEIAEIKEKFPKIRDLFENNEITELSKEEVKAILDIIKLQDDRAMYETDEMFKIGLREGKAL